MAKVTYEMHFSGTNRLMRSGDMRHALLQAALRGRSAAVAAGGGEGEYVIETSASGSGHWSDRAEARLIAEDEPYQESGRQPLDHAIDAIEQP